MADWNSQPQAPASQSADAFSTADMAANLPEAVQDKDLTSREGWVDRTAIDYDAYAPATGENHDRGGGGWDGNAAVYEWDSETGDIGPVVPELEVQLFGEKGTREPSAGIDFSAIAKIEVVQEGPTRVEPAMKFKDAGLHPTMLENVALCGYTTPTPIQSYCLPAIAKGYDVIGIAQTGSGKTAAFLIPIINKLMGKAKRLCAPRPNPIEYSFEINGPVTAEPLVVIVCPTRELAIQAFNESRKLCYRSMLRPAVIYGGGPVVDQIRQTSKGCDILCATPGRLIHFMTRPDLLSLRRVKYMVIDEADEMLTADWEDDLKHILGGGEQEEGNITYCLFSATFPKKIRDLAKTHLAEEHVRFRVGRAGSTHGNIIQTIVETAPAEKRRALNDLIASLPPQRTIIFVNSKAVADELDDYLYNECKLPCTSLHSDRTQKEREDALRAFRKGDAPIMVATGVSARGIDVRNVAHVINYDLPSIEYGGIEEYVHRIGRTGRIGNKGLATSFYTQRDEPLASVLVRTMLETDQEIPEFLSSYIPEGEAREKLKFEQDSDWEDENEADAGDAGGGWGAGSNNGDGDAPAASAWGAPDDNANNDTPAADAWGASTDNNAASASAPDAWGAPAANDNGGGSGWSSAKPDEPKQAAARGWSGGGSGW